MYVCEPLGNVACEVGRCYLGDNLWAAGVTTSVSTYL